VDIGKTQIVSELLEVIFIDIGDSGLVRIRSLIFNEDYFGSHRGIHPLTGPFETKEAAQQELF
jgi:hypothetical protein